jgi:hypothetical protein
MKRALIVFFVSVSVCGLFGCGSSKPVVEEATVAPESAPAQIRTENRAARADNKKVTAAKPEVVKKQDAPHVDAAVADEQREAKPVDMKIANGLERNLYLSSIVKPLLPPRTKMMDAAAGFKNQRQFIAALHVSKNLGIPFDEIKTRMTAEHRMSLNDSLRDIRPDMTKNLAKAEANKGEQQAKDDENQAKDEAKKAAAQEKLAANAKS